MSMELDGVMKARLDKMRMELVEEYGEAIGGIVSGVMTEVVASIVLRSLKAGVDPRESMDAFLGVVRSIDEMAGQEVEKGRRAGFN